MHARPIIFIAALVGGAGYLLWWLNNKPETYTAPEGYSVDYPGGWEYKLVDGSLKVYGVITGGGGGSGTGHSSYHPHEGSDKVNWPGQAQQLFPLKPYFEEQTQIDDRRAIVAFLNDGSTKSVAGVVDRGDGLIYVQLNAPAVAFDDHKAAYERCVRGIRCNKPK